ncbi:MAG: phosphotransferase [Acidobacteria bacterium]|nr:phosphotransferase [Acidobacteriota bacterium]
MSRLPERTLITPPVKAFLGRSIGSGFRIKEIAGDASTRKFYRVTRGRKTAVLMVHPEPLTPASPLFSNHRVMNSIGAPVPRILDSDPAAGLVLVEDLGDATLQKHLLGSGTRGRPAGGWRAAVPLYRQACDLIVLFHEKGAAGLRPGDFAATSALDCDRFLFELDHFHRHFIKGYRRMVPSEGDEAVLRAFYSDLALRCDRLPHVYCHRDFQSRNLLVRRGRLGLVDFQDARMGPYTYDAASLLRDSSLDLDERLVDEMIDRLCMRLDLPVDEFRRDFDLMALERNIKDLGTFGYMAAVRGCPEYLEYVPRTVRFIRRTLLAGRRYHLFMPALERYVLPSDRLR